MSNENAPDILSLFDKYNVELNDNNAKSNWFGTSC